MIVSEFIEWLKTKPQHLEVCVVELEEQFGEDYTYTDIQSVAFDDPVIQSTETALTLTLGGY